jgi:hypothetical protein
MRTIGTIVLAAAVTGGLLAIAPAASASPFPYPHTHDHGPLFNNVADWGVSGGDLANSFANPTMPVENGIANL